MSFLLTHSVRSLFKLVRNKCSKPADMITENGNWKFDFKCLLKDAKADQLAELFVVIGCSPPPLDDLRDTRRWFNNSSIFIVNFLYFKLMLSE